MSDTLRRAGPLSKPWGLGEAQRTDSRDCPCDIFTVRIHVHEELANHDDFAASPVP